MSKSYTMEFFDYVVGGLIYYRLPNTECSFMVMDDNRNFVKKIGSNVVQVTSIPDEALHFYDEETATAIAYELQARTNKWFGVYLIDWIEDEGDAE